MLFVVRVVPCFRLLVGKAPCQPRPLNSRGEHLLQFNAAHAVAARVVQRVQDFPGKVAIPHPALDLRDQVHVRSWYRSL
jgi:hypothetical protein